MLRLTLPLLLLLAAPTSASAAPPWSDPAVVPGSELGPVFDPGALAARGLVARRTAGGPVATVGPDGRPSPARRIGGLQLSAVQRGVGFGDTTAERPDAVVVTGLESTPRTTAIAPGESVAVALDVLPRGDVAALIGACTDARCRRVVPTLAVRRRGATRFRRYALGSAQARFAGTVSLGPTGRILVAWERGRDGGLGQRSIRARRLVDGRLGATRILGSAPPSVSLEGALSSGDAAVVAWKSQTFSEGGFASPATVSAAVAPAGRPFGPGRRLESTTRRSGREGGDGDRASVGRGLAIASTSSRSVVAWTGEQDGRFVLRVADVGAARVGSPTTIAASGADLRLGDLAKTVGGEDVVVAEREGEIVAAVRRIGAPAFGPLELVSAPGAVASAPRLGTVGGGAPLAVWSQPEGLLVAVRERLP